MFSIHCARVHRLIDPNVEQLMSTFPWTLSMPDLSMNTLEKSNIGLIEPGPFHSSMY